MKKLIYKLLQKYINKLSLIIIIAVVVIISIYMLPNFITSLVEKGFFERQTKIMPSAIIVERLQALNKLETIKQNNMQIVEVESNNKVFPAFLTGDKLMMVAQTEVVAGIDLSYLDKTKVKVSGRNIKLVLPNPTIFNISINDGSSYVYSRQTGIFVFNPDPDLERQARLRAIADARKAALKNGILDIAKTNAQQNIINLLSSFGYEQIKIEWI